MASASRTAAGARFASLGTSTTPRQKARGLALALLALSITLGSLVVPTASAGPSPPSPLHVVVSGTSEVALTWSPISATSWNFYLGTDAGMPCDGSTLYATRAQPSSSSGGGWEISIGASPNNFVYGIPSVTGPFLSASTTYFFRVQASDGTGAGPCSGVVSGTTFAPPPAPTNGSIAFSDFRPAIGNTSLTFNWTRSSAPPHDPSDGIGFDFYISTSPDGSACQPFPTQGGSQPGTSVFIADQYYTVGYAHYAVTAGVTYYVSAQMMETWYAAYASYKDVGSCMTPFLNFTLPAPSAVVDGTSGEAYVNLSWSNVTAAVTYSLFSHAGYPPPDITCALNLSCSMNSTSYTYRGSYANTTRTFNDTPLVDNRPYYYVVLPTNATDAEGFPSNVFNATPLAAPPTVNATAGDALVDLSWTLPNDTTTVSAWRALNATPDISCVTARTCTMNATGYAYYGTFDSLTSATDNSAPNGMTAHYVFSGVNSAGEGAPSLVANATPMPSLSTAGAGSPTLNQLGFWMTLLFVPLLLGAIIVLIFKVVHR